MPDHPTVLLTIVILPACSGAVEQSLDLAVDPNVDPDVGAEDECLSWHVEPDWLDVESLIEPWNGHAPLRAFSQHSGFLDCFRPRVLSDDGGGIILVASAEAECQAGDEGPCTSLFAQRISGRGALLWGDSGIRLTDAPVPSGDCPSNGIYGPHEITGDGSGGFYIVLRPGPDGLDFLVNRIKGDGSRSFTFMEPLHFPIDELVEVRGYVPESIGLGDIIRMSDERLLLSMHLTYGYGDSDYYLASVNPDWSVASYDFLEAGAVLSRFFESADSGILNITNADPMYNTQGTAWMASRFMDFGGAMTGRDSVDLAFNSFEFSIVDYDLKASAIYLHDTNLVTKVAVLPEIRGLLNRWHWMGYQSVQTFTDFAGDGTGGIFLSGRQEQEMDDVIDDPHCVGDTHRSVLIHHWLDSNGTDRTLEEDMVLDSFASHRWYPNPLLLRSVSGDILQLWMVPLVHEGSALPDFFSYDRGYYVCAQRHGIDDLHRWAGYPCERAAQIIDSDFDVGRPSTWWFDAVEDGVGGLILAVYNPRLGILVQRLSPSGELMWDGGE